MMVPASLLSLPSEILDGVYAYLDWDPSESLYPSRPDIISISLTCRRLRESILPTLFRHLVLRLRWYGGSLIEPALFRLRRDRPDLARNVRSVYMQTEFYRNHDTAATLTPFDVPDGLADWIRPAAHLGESEDFGERHHRQRVEVVAKQVFNGLPQADSLSEVSAFIKGRTDTFQRYILHPRGSEVISAPAQRPRPFYYVQSMAEETFEDHMLPDGWGNGMYHTAPTRVSRDQRGELDVMMLQFDALVVAILCFPANVTSLAFKAHPRGETHNLRNAFALHVAAAACKIFGDRLERLNVTSSPSDTQRLGPAVRERPVKENSILTNEVLSEFRKLSTLVISDKEGQESSRPRTLMAEHEVSWTQLATTVVRLELWNCSHEKGGLLHFIKCFVNLETLALERFSLFETPGIGARHTGPKRSMWLAWLIQLRRERPQLALRLGALTYGRTAYTGQTRLPGSAVSWLMHEAVSTGCTVGLEREDRLTEDFESFWDLWSAEDGDRGAQAREARKDGNLVDEAMTNRWKTYAHLRK